MSGPGEPAAYGDTACLYTDDKGCCAHAGVVHVLLDQPVGDGRNLATTIACQHHFLIIVRLSKVYGIHTVQEICHVPESKWDQQSPLQSACIIPDDELEQEAARMALVDEVRQHQGA